MRNLSNQLKSKLQSIEDIESVYDYPWLDFDGYPAATITPSGLDSDYESTVENLRTYIFVVRLFVNLNNVNQPTEQKKVEDGFRIAEELVDTVIDTFDQDETLAGISLPSGYTMVAITPTPSVINYFVEDKMIVAEVKINVKVSFDTSA